MKRLLLFVSVLSTFFSQKKSGFITRLCSIITRLVDRTICLIIDGQLIKFKKTVNVMKASKQLWTAVVFHRIFNLGLFDCNDVFVTPLFYILKLGIWKHNLNIDQPYKMSTQWGEERWENRLKILNSKITLAIVISYHHRYPDMRALGKIGNPR